MRVRAFSEDDAERWDACCAAAVNATFLHTRRFLAYHGNRFDDLSLVVEDAQGAVLGVLPAARDPQDPDTVVSHPGSTYGGLVHGGALRGEAMVQALAAAAAHHGALGLRRLRYKALPHAYHRAPAQDDLYALQRLGAQRSRCDLSSCIDLAHRLPVATRRRRALARARRAGLQVHAGDAARAGLPALWDVLRENLRQRHGVEPVHTLDEMAALAQRFPQHIAVRLACRAAHVLAGSVLFRTGAVVHAQYLANSDEGRECGALDLVLETAIDEARADGARYFDFGISTEDGGRRLNAGLHAYKSEFGAGALVHEFYELALPCVGN